jgi:hypothetical protein
MAESPLENPGSVDAGDPVVDLDEPVERKGEKFTFDERDPNLAFEFSKTEKGRDTLKRLSSQVIEDFDADWEASSEYRERMARDFRIFAGELPKKEFPFDKSANAHLPLMLENITRIAHRAEAELFGDWRHVFDVMGIGPDDDEVAQILTRHGNWQLAHQLPDFKRQQARGVLIFFTVGDVTCHSYRDNVRRLNMHEILTCDEFVTPYSHVTTMPDYSDLPHVTKIVYRYKHELQQMREVWFDVDRVIKGDPPSWEDEPSSDLQKSISQEMGIEPSDSKRSNAYKLLWQEGWFELDGDEQRFCQVIVDYKTRAVLSLAIHERDNWQDRERYDRQIAERDQYVAAVQQFMQAQAQYAAMQQAHSEIAAEIPMLAVDPQHQADLQAAQAPLPPPPPPPVMPDWLMEAQADMATAATIEPEPVRREPLHMFSHGVCLESLVGNLGLSYGRQQADHNRAVDTWLSQYTDSATLGNTWSLIVAGGAEFERPFKIAPGSVNVLKNVPAGEIDRYIKELKPAPANQQFMDLIGLVWDKSQTSIQSAPVLSGEAGKSGETFRGMATRVDQASKQLSVPTRKYGDFFTQIAKNNAYLNYVFMDDEEIILVNNERMGRMDELRVGRQMYGRNYQIAFKSEINFASDETRIAKADELVQLAMQIPPLQGNPRYVYDALRKSLELRGRYDLVDDLGPPPPPTELPFGAPPPPPPGMPPGGPEQGNGGGPPPQQ